MESEHFEDLDIDGTILYEDVKLVHLAADMEHIQVTVKT
jgi:hypothetical protein